MMVHILAEVTGYLNSNGWNRLNAIYSVKELEQFLSKVIF